MKCLLLYSRIVNLKFHIPSSYVKVLLLFYNCTSNSKPLTISDIDELGPNHNKVGITGGELLPLVCVLQETSTVLPIAKINLSECCLSLTQVKHKFF